MLVPASMGTRRGPCLSRVMHLTCCCLLCPFCSHRPVCPTHHLLLHPHQPERAHTPCLPPSPVLLPTCMSACALEQPQEQTPVGGPHTEVRLRPQLNLRGRTTKEELLKSLLAYAGTADLQPCCWVCKLSTCGTSQWTSAPVAEMGLALAAVGFVGTYTQ